MSRQAETVPARERTTYERSHAVRLPDYDYAGPEDIHLIVCADRGAPFAERKLAQTVCESVEHTCRIRDYRLYGYCLMPDHLHVLLSPAASGVAVMDWLQSFKGFTTNAYMKRGGKPPLWQRSAYDHVCRSEETAEKVLTYIVNNPVDAGLVDRWEDWPWMRVFIEL